MKITSGFTTTVKSLKSDGGGIKITLDEMPRVEFSLTDHQSQSIGLKKGSRVTVKPTVEESEFTLAVNEEAEVPENRSTSERTTGRPSSPAMGFTVSNKL
jgi:hypothetical protein